jgi:RHS repeat-associated protein
MGCLKLVENKSLELKIVSEKKSVRSEKTFKKERSYLEARYYNPKISNWLSVDPLALFDPINETEHYLDGEHNGGYFNPRNASVYGYTYQNPIRYIDPNGKQSDAVAVGIGVLVGEVSQVITNVAKQVIKRAVGGLVNLFFEGSDLNEGEEDFLKNQSNENKENARRDLNLGKGKDSKERGDKSNGIGSKNTAKGDKMGSNKQANKQIDDVSKKNNLDRKSFGKFIEKMKKNEGKKGADNYSWKQLQEIAKKFKEIKE